MAIICWVNIDAQQPSPPPFLPYHHYHPKCPIASISPSRCDGVRNSRYGKQRVHPPSSDKQNRNADDVSASVSLVLIFGAAHKQKHGLKSPPVSRNRLLFSRPDSTVQSNQMIQTSKRIGAINGFTHRSEPSHSNSFE